MNWGAKIVVSLVTFIVFIVGSCIYMITKDTDSLEEDDYYEKSLSFDQEYNSRENLEKDKTKPMVTVSKDTLYIHFTKLDNKGKLIFKRPSDGSLDVSLPFSTPSDSFQLPLTTFVKGSWNLEVDWKNNNTSYISSHRIFI